MNQKRVGSIKMGLFLLAVTLLIQMNCTLSRATQIPLTTDKRPRGALRMKDQGTSNGQLVYLPLTLRNDRASGVPLPLSEVIYWGYQIQNISTGVDALAASHYDMLVLEPTRTDWSSDNKLFNTREMVQRLKSSQAHDGTHRKLVIAYIDIGQAEDWRWYWKWSTGWDCTSPRPADWPGYILTCDPDGWAGNYPVAYWDTRWKDIVISGTQQSSAPYGDYTSILNEAIQDGFDGVYLDWVEGFENESVIKAAQAAGKEAAVEMIALIRQIRDYARARKPGFLIIQQNAAALIEEHPTSTAVIDAIAQEGIWYDGVATDNWNDPEGYDMPTDPTLVNEYIGYLDQYRQARIPVFNCEYALKHAGLAYTNAHQHGYIPYVTRRSLGQLTTTPPPGYISAPERGISSANGPRITRVSFQSPAATSPHQASLTVNTLKDEADGKCNDGDCSLRDAIAVSQANDTIGFSVSGFITLTLGSLKVDNNLTINGPGASRLVVSGNHITRTFHITGGVTAAISNLTIANGEAEEGGGMVNLGNLTLTGCAFTGNHSLGQGGGLHNEGKLTSSGCAFSGNQADNDGGGLYNYGGVITLTNNTFTNNTAGNDSAGVGNAGFGLAANAPEDVLSSAATLSGCTFSGNQAANNAGGLGNDWSPLNVISGTFTNNSAGNDAGSIYNFGNLSVISSTFSGNQAGNDGGAIVNHNTLTVTNSTFSSNTSGNSGGGIANTSILSVTGSTFSGNSTQGDGGGIDNDGALTLVNSTLTANQAEGTGGGIANTWSVMTATNSTISGNSAADGGGIYSTYDVSATLVNTLVVNNAQGGNCSGPIAAGSQKNLSSDGSCSPGFNQVTPAQLALGTLTGKPAYFPLKAGSSAVDGGTNDGCPATDQRGVARPQDGNGDGSAMCDVGSYELVGQVQKRRLYQPMIIR